MLTGWYGLGYAIDDFLSSQGGSGLKLLRGMSLKSPDFRLAVEVQCSEIINPKVVVAGLVPAIHRGACVIYPEQVRQ